ncbi:MAG: amphi-Trp domain-containing protein [Nannocystaceae bacterium]|nr:amphi-Trp domain-containing protein [bacterium]
MSDHGKTFRHESIQDAKALADHLDEIAEALRAGTLHLRDEGGELALQPQGLVRFALSGQQQPDQASLTLTLAWRPEQELSASSLTISRSSDDGTPGS